MPIPLCPSQMQPQPQPQSQPQPQRTDSRPPRSRGQVLVIFAVSLVALLLFIGLAVDTGLMYLSYGQLKRAVDAAAVNAANNFKSGKTLDQMTASALEELRMHNVDTTNLHLNVLVCDANLDGSVDSTLQTTAPSFYALCPNINLLVPLAPGQSRPSPRKLVYVQATQRAPFYFLSLLGISGVNLTTSSVGEAAAIDLVLVIDTSESMATECLDNAKPCTHYGSSGYVFPDSVNNYDPNATNGCNTDNSCQPLRAAKDAAIKLVETLYPGYDAVGLVNLNTVAVSQVIKNGEPPLVNVLYKSDIETAIRSLPLHDDAPAALLSDHWAVAGRVNPIWPDDRDGDGADYDDDLGKLHYTHICPDNTRWDDSQDPFGWGGVPCDDPNLLDAFHWAPNNTAIQDDTIAQAWLANPHHSSNRKNSFSLVSTCTGCGIREGANMLQKYGRSGSVWVMVLLSDGGANMSDTPTTGGTDPVTGDPVIPTVYDYLGFCQGGFNAGFWINPICMDTTPNIRYCIYTTTTYCPPGTTPVSNRTSYSNEDYAKDMTDRAALYNTHRDGEIAGNQISIYAIGLNVNPDPKVSSAGELLLRYVAFIGATNDRTLKDPCQDVAPSKSCGNYYYASGGSSLAGIFDSIASRIYTRISN